MGGAGRMGRGGATAGTADLSPDGVERRDGKITASGLAVAFPDGFECAPIASPFASPTRFDGSSRRGDRFEGLHGGMDLSLKEGTPLLAMAGGEVIARGEGGRLEGVFLWLRHAPAETGLPFWVFAKYQHLAALPELQAGERVQAGQIVARSGKTGTAGGYYGAAGYPHLHLSTFYGPSAAYSIKGIYRSMVQGQDAVIDDPLILFLRGVTDLSQVRDLALARKQISVAVAGEEGAIYPAGGAPVWPSPCKRK